MSIGAESDCDIVLLGGDSHGHFVEKSGVLESEIEVDDSGLYRLEWLQITGSDRQFACYVHLSVSSPAACVMLLTCACAAV